MQSIQEKYKDDRKWSLKNSQVATVQLNLPNQPAGSAADCAVLVCFHMWSYMIGMAWPPPAFESGSKTEVADRKIITQLMSDARGNIGSDIATNGVMD